MASSTADRNCSAAASALSRVRRDERLAFLCGEVEPIRTAVHAQDAHRIYILDFPHCSPPLLGGKRHSCDGSISRPTARLMYDMPSVVYRCWTTGNKVEVWFADDVTEDNVYVSLRCPACARVHLVNRQGRTLVPPAS
jgi:hypothetical protein